MANHQIGQWLEDAIKRLEEAGIATARLDALVLLEDALGRDRASLLAHTEDEIDIQTYQSLSKQLARRARHEPLAYIRGRAEFYGREFIVKPVTLQPRPETETLIELLIEQLKVRGQDVACLIDIGTGSGAIAITAKLEFPKLAVYATEINQDALEVARINADKLGADVGFYRGNLLEPLLELRTQPSVLLANLPYVPDSHTINQAAMQEPAIAIFGGPDGLDLYREMFEQVPALSPALILTESLPFQHETLARIAVQAGYKPVASQDFIQVFAR